MLIKSTNMWKTIGFFCKCILIILIFLSCSSGREALGEVIGGLRYPQTIIAQHGNITGIKEESAVRFKIQNGKIILPTLRTGFRLMSYHADEFIRKVEIQTPLDKQDFWVSPLGLDLTIMKREYDHEWKDISLINSSEIESKCKAGPGYQKINVPVSMKIYIGHEPSGIHAAHAKTPDPVRTDNLVISLQCLQQTEASLVKRYKYTCPSSMVLAGDCKLSSREVDTSVKFQSTPPSSLKCVERATCVPSTDKACPFILTRETPDGEWIEQGTILTHHNGKEQERTEVVELSAFSGSVLIEERDPETSYIDSLSVVLYYADGSKEVLLPDREELKAVDGSYLVTNQGDVVEVKFEKASRTDFVKAEVVANGYYEPY